MMFFKSILLAILLCCLLGLIVYVIGSIGACIVDWIKNWRRFELNDIVEINEPEMLEHRQQGVITYIFLSRKRYEVLSDGRRYHPYEHSLKLIHREWKPKRNVRRFFKRRRFKIGNIVQVDNRKTLYEIIDKNSKKHALISLNGRKRLYVDIDDMTKFPMNRNGANK